MRRDLGKASSCQYLSMAKGGRVWSICPKNVKHPIRVLFNTKCSFSLAYIRYLKERAQGAIPPPPPGRTQQGGQRGGSCRAVAPPPRNFQCNVLFHSYTFFKKFHPKCAPDRSILSPKMQKLPVGGGTHPPPARALRSLACILPQIWR